MIDLHGRRAIVTGGASGIGAATATLLRDRGAAVVTLDIATGADLTADVRDEAAVEAAVEAAADRLGGPVDLLVASAGVYRIAPLLDLDAASWDDTLAINLRGVFLSGRAVAARLRAADLPGSIVNLSSIAALVGDAAEPAAHYNASKAGVIALTQQMAIELAPQIRVNCVCPGMIETPMLRVTDDPDRARRMLDDAVPLRRFGCAEEVARVIAFLASDAASYVTGTALPIDGGATIL